MHLHRLPSLGQLPPGFLTVRVYVPDEDPIEIDIEATSKLHRYLLLGARHPVRGSGYCRRKRRPECLSIFGWLGPATDAGPRLQKTRGTVANSTVPVPADIDPMAAARDSGLLVASESTAEPQTEPPQNRPFDETSPTPTRQPASVGRFGSREFVSKSKSHSWPARRGFVRLPHSPHRLLVPPARAQPSNPDADMPSDRPGTFPGGMSFFRRAHRIGMCWKAQPLHLSFPTTHRLQPQEQEFRPFAVVRPRLSPYHNHGPQLVQPQGRTSGPHGRLGPGRPGWLPTQVSGKEVTSPPPPPGSRGALLLPSPLRTTRKPFGLCRSSLSQGSLRNPVGHKCTTCTILVWS